MAVFELGGKILGGGSSLRHTKDNKYDLEFMDHADYSTIIQYVKKASPKVVITDYARGRQGMKLAENLKKEGFQAIALPMNS
jgi:Cft2 family RNA processing exonuclease